MKLYEVKLPAKVDCECSDGSEFITVDHLDGKYYSCITEKGNMALLSAFEELEAIGDNHYKLICLK